MSYTKYTSKLINEVLGLKTQKTDLFGSPPVKRLQASQRLLLNLEAAKVLHLSTEKAVCEHLVSPILTEIRLCNENIVDFYSGEQLNVDKKRNLNGEIDFMFTKASQSFGIHSPILCITEAKIGLIDKGMPQAAAQMYAARLFNETEGNPTPIVYGAVTDGKTWRFMKLEGQTVFTDLTVLYLDDLPLLLGVLQKVIDFYR